MKKNILFTILSGFATFVCVGGAVAQSQINRSAYSWREPLIAMN